MKKLVFLFGMFLLFFLMSASQASAYCSAPPPGGICAPPTDQSCVTQTTTLCCTDSAVDCTPMFKDQLDHNYNLCTQITSEDPVKTANVIKKCQDCTMDPQNIWTAIGCVKAGNPLTFIGQILGWAVILGGGIAFAIIAFAGYQISTAAGDAKVVKAAQETITAAIMGLLLIIFSIFLLNLVGISILDLNNPVFNIKFPTPNP